MIEKIGQVTLDFTWYPGQDLYTDGAIEDEMLEIAREYPAKEYNQVIARRKSWPILYHFSHIRENIASWLPFTGEEKVLEIGSGCGAITGALTSRAKEVTCIELSRKRSEINAWRHRDKDNLRILVGNFQEIEKNLTEKYDYITLIGVFEYGEAYIQSQNPYVDFLKTIARHLKPHGKIVMAIENRFGLKYWAGCTEDHFGTLYEGLEGYPSTKGVKTFTQKEIRRILKEAGDLQGVFYYPFPDYKFPLTIYSDHRLPLPGELNRVEYNFDRYRLDTFQESAVYDSLLDNDLYPQFSNSFLLLIDQEGKYPETVYTKFSNERDPRFNIRTDICRKDDGSKYVRKVPFQAEAGEHVENLERIASSLAASYEKEGLLVNTCQREEAGAVLEYVEGVTLEEKLDILLKEGEYEALQKLLFQYVEKVRRIHSQEVFHKTEEFVRIFGDEPLQEQVPCGAVSNIDLVPGNLLLGEEKTWVLDYEWTFFFPIPASYLIFRMIHYYLESDSKRHVLWERDFYGQAGITPNEQEMYRRMEARFQQYMLGGHVPVVSMYQDISPGRADVRTYYEQRRMAEAPSLQVFYDLGQGFQEQDSSKYPMDPTGVCLTVPVPEQAGKIRLDPGENPGCFAVRCLKWDNGEKASYTVNGIQLEEQLYYFGAGDPQILVGKIPEGAVSLQIELEKVLEEKSNAQLWAEVAAQDQERRRVLREKERELRRQIQRADHLKQVIYEMENTKVWKMYKTLKKDKK